MKKVCGVQCMHIGAFDEEPRTIALMDAFLRENGYENDFSNGRMHHEIYLSDARRVPQEKWRTVIRHPVRENMMQEKQNEKMQILRQKNKRQF